MINRTPTLCPVVFSLDVFGDKWSLLILRDLIILNKRHFRDFLKSNENISTNILADRLERFMKADLVTKQEDPKNKSAAIYTPTKKALELIPILFAIMHWGFKYNPDTDMSIPLAQELVADEEAFKKRLLAQFASEANVHQ